MPRYEVVMILNVLPIRDYPSQEGRVYKCGNSSTCPSYTVYIDLRTFTNTVGHSQTDPTQRNKKPFVIASHSDKEDKPYHSFAAKVQSNGARPPNITESSTLMGHSKRRNLVATGIGGIQRRPRRHSQSFRRI